MDKSISEGFREAAIERVPVELHQRLKLANLTASDGEAKFAISQGQVRVNGQVETRKRKKIVSGDLVEFAGIRLRVIAGSAEAPLE